MRQGRCVVVFAKPPRPGRVKTRLIGPLTAEQAARLHAALLDDLRDRLRPGAFELRTAWAVEEGDTLPEGDLRQRGRDLGERLFHGLSAAARRHRLVAAVGSDHPELDPSRVEEGFDKLSRGADVVVGPATDGGYYLIACGPQGLDRRIFSGIDWSTERVLAQTLARCRTLGLVVSRLPMETDVDTPGDLERLAARLRGGAAGCPRTRELLAGWGWLGPGSEGGSR